MRYEACEDGSYTVFFRDSWMAVKALPPYWHTYHKHSIAKAALDRASASLRRATGRLVRAKPGSEKDARKRVADAQKRVNAMRDRVASLAQSLNAMQRESGRWEEGDITGQ